MLKRESMVKPFKGLSLFLLFFLLALPLYGAIAAEDTVSPAADAMPESTVPQPAVTKDPEKPLTLVKPLGFMDFLSAFAALGFVLLLIYAISWFMRRSGLLMTGNPSHIKPLAVLPLGHKQRLALIEVGRQQVLIGISSDRIDTIMPIDPPIQWDQHPPGRSVFAQVLTAKQKQGTEDA